MNKRSIDIEAAANIGRVVKAGTKKAALKKPAAKKPATKAPVKKTAPAKNTAETTPVEKPAKPAKPEPNKVANSGKAYQPTLPGMRNLAQFKDTSAK